MIRLEMKYYLMIRLAFLFSFVYRASHPSTWKLPSLMLLGFPRGFTSDSYEITWRSLPFLKRPMISAGEVLNYQRFSSKNLKSEGNFHFWLPENHNEFPAACRWIEKRLDQYTGGYIIKDVVHPLQVLKYLDKYPENYRVLYIRRDPELVRYFTDKKGWQMNLDLYTLDQKFKKYPVLEVEKALYSEKYFHQVLSRVYPMARCARYMTKSFVQRRENRKRLFEQHIMNKK